MQDLVPVYGPITQNSFLSHMGLMIRLEKLFAGAGGDKAKMDRIREGAQRLINPVQMGNEYSVMGISTNDGPQHPFQLDISKSDGCSDEQRIAPEASQDMQRLR